MKKKILVLSSLSLFALVGALLSNVNYAKANAEKAEVFTHELGGSKIIKDFDAAFKAKKTADGDNFDPSTVTLTATNGAYTYGIGHGDLYGGHFYAFDSLESNKFFASEHASDTKSYASTFGNNYGNPYIFTGHLDGFVFWFTANEALTFEMPEVALTPQAAGGSNGVFKNLYRKIFVKGNGKTDYSQKQSFQFANVDTAQTLPAVSKITISQGDTVCFELRRSWNDSGSTSYGFQGISLPFVLSNLVGYANDAKAELDAAVAALKEEDYSTTNWSTIQTELTNGKNAIDAATTVDAINSAKTEALGKIAAVKTVAQETAEALAQAKTDAKARVVAAAEALNETDYSADMWTAIGNIVTAANASIDGSETIDKVTASADNAIALIGQVPTAAEEALDAAKTSAKNDLNDAVTALNETDYSATNWATIQTAKTNGLTAINEATTVEDVNTAKTNALNAINAVKTIAQEEADALATAKTNAKAELDQVVAAKTETDYSATNWSTIQTELANGKKAIDDATTTDAVIAAKNAALDKINAVKTAAQEAEEEAAAALATAKTNAKAEIENYATSKGQANYSQAGWNEIQGYVTQTKDAIDACPTVAKVNEKLAAGKDLIDLVETKTVEDLKAAKANAKDELARYYNAKDASKYTQEGVDAMAKAKRDGDAAIEAATSIEAVNNALANAKTAIDAVKEAEQPSKGGCGGSVAATSILLSSIALIGAGLLAFKRRKED